MAYLPFETKTTWRVEPYGKQEKTAHVFDVPSIDAINCALAAQRPLLVRGEPGAGKSQLARAAASALGRAFVPFTVDARTESRDLLYTVDTVARLAEAQIVGHLPDVDSADLAARISERRFTKPGPLWWVFDWAGAKAQAKGWEPPQPKGSNADRGAVLLIDEIDKADSSVPNGLLEALGQGEFTTPWGDTIAAGKADVVPLVVITTNEERSLPDAFVRRCLVLQIAWPRNPEELIAALVERGKAHFPRASKTLLEKAADLVAKDRAEVAARGVNPPGGAEYLDLVRAVLNLWPDDRAQQTAGLDRLRAFALSKHPKDSFE